MQKNTNKLVYYSLQKSVYESVYDFNHGHLKTNKSK